MTHSGQEPPLTGRGDPDADEKTGADPSSRRRARRRRKRRSPARFEKGGESTRTPDDQDVGPRSDADNTTPGKRRRAKPNRAQRRAGMRPGDRYRKQPTGVAIAGSLEDKAPPAETPVQGGEQSADRLTAERGRPGKRREGKRHRRGASSAAELRSGAGTPEMRPSRDGRRSGTSQKPDHQRGQPAKANRVRQDRTATERSQHSERLYAALDLGTNNCRLLVARPEQRGFRVVDAYSRIVRLGEGIGANGRLSEAAMDRAIDALASCHRKLADRGVMRSRLIATEACRSADNGTHFIDRVRRETGLALEIVNRETEARLAVAGCVTLVDPQADGVLLFDIGGGSSEIVWLDLRNRCGARGYALTRFIRSWISLPVGVVNLAERHGGVHVTPEIFENMVEDVSGYLEAFPNGEALSEAINTGFVHMLGTSGTVTTLAGVQLGLKRYDRRQVDGAWLDNGQVSSMIEHLRDLPYEQRVENPCIGADRADLVLAGCAILEAIRRRWTCQRLRVADRGLREGILTELMSADGVWSRKGGRRRGGRQRGTR